MVSQVVARLCGPNRQGTIPWGMEPAVGGPRIQRDAHEQMHGVGANRPEGRPSLVPSPLAPGTSCVRADAKRPARNHRTKHLWLQHAVHETHEMRDFNQRSNIMFVPPPRVA